MKPALVLVVVSAALVPSCMVGPNYVTPSAKVADQWMASSVTATQPAASSQPARAAEDCWWQNFDDPVLDRLIEAARRDNLSLQVAGARILEARAQLNRSIGELFPQQQQLTGQLNYSRPSGPSTGLPGNAPDNSTDQVLVAATWEIDFWGKYRRAIESDRATYLGTVASYDAALVTLLGDVASTYVNIRTLEERLRVAATNVETQKESLRLATVQFRAGATGERDVQQATAQLAQTQAQIPQLEESLRQAKDSLAVLIGQTPDVIDRELGGSGRIPTAPASVAVGIPRDLLRRRPDVRAAGLAAASKSALIGVAEANMYPSFSLSGDFGFGSSNLGRNSLGDIFLWDHHVANAAAGFIFPIFNYGRLINQVRVQDAQFQQAVLDYQNTVLVAQQEVEDGLAAFAQRQQAVVLYAQAATAARRSTELAMIQYKGGQTDYTTVLTAEQAQLAAEDSLADQQGGVVLGIITVYRALGGGWQIREGHDVLPDEVKADMARRICWGSMLEPPKHLPNAKEAEQGP